MNGYIEQNTAYQDMVSALYMTTEALAVLFVEKRPELTDMTISELQNYNDQLVARLRNRRDMK
jgi:di/tripeptidase